MIPLYTGVSGKILRYLEAVPTKKQEQYTQEYYIKIVSENSIDQLFAP